MTRPSWPAAVVVGALVGAVVAPVVGGTDVVPAPVEVVAVAPVVATAVAGTAVDAFAPVVSVAAPDVVSAVVVPGAAVVSPPFAGAAVVPADVAGSAVTSGVVASPAALEVVEGEVVSPPPEGLQAVVAAAIESIISQMPIVLSSLTNVSSFLLKKGTCI